MRTLYGEARNSLIRGLIILLNEKDIADIGVKELCLVSKVNRSTFYAHYRNIHELFEDCMKHMVRTFLEPYSEIQRKKNAEGDLEPDYIKEEYVLPYLKQIRKNSVIYRAYLNLTRRMGEDPFFERLLEKISIPVARMNDGSIGRKEITFVSLFYLAGINAIVSKWMNEGFKEKEEVICRIIVKLVSDGKNNRI